LCKNVSPNVAVAGLKAESFASAEEGYEAVAGVNMNDREARPRARARGSRVIGVAEWAAAMEGMLSKYVTRKTGKYEAKAPYRVTLYIPAARIVVKVWMVRSVTMSLFGTATDFEEVDDAWAGDSGRRSRKGR
jgi:hypothetical protein